MSQDRPLASVMGHCRAVAGALAGGGGEQDVLWWRGRGGLWLGGSGAVLGGLWQGGCGGVGEGEVGLCWGSCGWQGAGLWLGGVRLWGACGCVWGAVAGRGAPVKVSASSAWPCFPLSHPSPAARSSRPPHTDPLLSPPSTYIPVPSKIKVRKDQVSGAHAHCDALPGGTWWGGHPPRCRHLASGSPGRWAGGVPAGGTDPGTLDRQHRLGDSQMQPPNPHQTYLGL